MKKRYGKRLAVGLMILTLGAAVLPTGVLRAEAKERTAALLRC